MHTRAFALSLLLLVFALKAHAFIGVGQPVISNGVITGINIISAGSGFTQAPRVSITDEGGGSGAFAFATITNGKVTSVLVLLGGTGYSDETLVYFLAKSDDISDPGDSPGDHPDDTPDPTIDQQPTTVSISTGEVPEGAAPGSVVGELAAPDLPTGQTLIFGLADSVDYPDNASFTVVGNDLTTAAALDFESQALYSLRILVVDSSDEVYYEDLEVSVTDRPESPVDPQLSDTTVPEGEPVATLVGILSALDPDIGDSHTFSLPEDAAYPDNSKFQLNGNRLETSVSMDAGATILVRATDSTGLFVEREFAITTTRKLFATETDLGGGWKYLGWLGLYFLPKGSDYLYLDGMGWLYPAMASESSFWLYSHDIGWFWTEPTLFPMVYKYIQATGTFD